MAFDSRADPAERPVLPEVRTCFRPMLTADGRRIVFTEAPHQRNHTVWVVDFDGRGLRRVGPGMAVEVRREPKSGCDICLIQRGEETGRRFERNPIYAVPLDAPAEATLLWDRTPSAFNNFQTSLDGTRAAIEAPWPTCISAALASGEWHVFGRGCYPAMAPDNSYLAWHMDGRHRGLFLFTASGRTPWYVPINTVPGFDGRKIGQPRWTNHVRYLALAGPSPEGDSGRGGVDEIEVYVGRFAPDFRRVEAWARVSHTARQSQFPDVWIEGGERAQAPPIADPPEAGPLASPVGTWPGFREGLVFLWDHAKADNQFKDPVTGDAATGRVVPSGRATFGRFEAMDTAGGTFEAPDAADRIVRAVRMTRAFALELVLTADSARRRTSGAVATMWDPKGEGDFCLEQWRQGLGFFIRTHMRRDGTRPGGTWHPLGEVRPGRPQHVLVTCRRDRLEAWLNGQLVVVNVDQDADFSLWGPYPLLFGNGPDGKWNFGGCIEGVALYSRYVSAEEAAAKYRLFEERLAARRPARRAAAEAELLEVGPKVDTKAMGAYRRALVERPYRVLKVLEGTCPPGPIRVAEWAVMDLAPVDAFAERKPGQAYRLDLEPWEDHPELESEWRVQAGPPAPGTAVFYQRSRTPTDRRAPAVRLREAIEEGDLADIEDVLREDPRLLEEPIEEKRSGRRLRPIELAAESIHRWSEENLEVVRALMARGAACDLFTAARAGMFERVEALLKEDPKAVEARDRFGYTALQRAALAPWPSRSVEAVADLLQERGARVDGFIAAHRGDAAALEALLKADPALLESRDPAGLTPLMWSVRPGRRGRGAADATRLLLRMGADPNRRNDKDDSKTALHYLAEWTGQPDQVDVLKEFKADLNARTAAGKTPLDLALEEPWRRDVAERLKKLGAEPSPKPPETPAEKPAAPTAAPN
jgi:hypothetical protein